jgi:tryptophanyl-tRNA synthetase
MKLSIDNKMTNQTVNPWQAEALNGFNYNMLLKEFGLQRIDDSFMKKFTDITGVEPHPLMKRGIFFAHQDMDTFWIITRVAKKRSFILDVDLQVKVYISVT